MDKLFRITATIGVIIVIVALALYKQPSGSTYVPPLDVESMMDYVVDAGMDQMTPAERQKLLESRVIVHTTDINAAFGRSLISKLLLLAEDSETEPIDLYIRTEGGWEADIFSVVDVMRTIKPPVNVHAIGDVHSSGLVILSAATGKRLVYENTILGFHAVDRVDDVIYRNRYLNHFRKYGRFPESWLNANDGEYYLFSAEEAINYRIADEIVPNQHPTPTGKVAAKADKE